MNPCKGKTFPVELLARGEVKALLDACGTAPVGVRNRALLGIGYRAGLRLAEALALELKDLDPASGALRVLHGKGDVARTAGMDAWGWQLLETWLQVRDLWISPPSAIRNHSTISSRTLSGQPFGKSNGVAAKETGKAWPLGSKPNGKEVIFCTKGGCTLWDCYVRNLMKRLAKQAGISKRVHYHALRHALASELRAEGVDIGIISKQLGHADIATTARYLDHLNPHQVLQAMRARQAG